jgi:hypothetical protein
VRDILHIEALQEKKDVAALVTICQEEGAPDGVEVRRRAAAEALGKLDCVAAIQSALDKKPKEASALIDALGLSSDPAALEVLKGVARREREGDENRVRSIVHALARKGKAGREILQELAENERSVLAKAADRQLGLVPADEAEERNELLDRRDRLERDADEVRNEVTRASPKAGSLPKTLGDLR